MYSKKNGDLHILHSGYSHIAREFTAEEQRMLVNMLPSAYAAAGGMQGAGKFGGMVLQGAAPADTYICGGCASTFELAWHLHEQNMLPDWGAVIALTQDTGRGQMRRPWFSPHGNLYVSFKLPSSEIFKGSEATVLLGLLLVLAFERLGLSLRIKWPNDLVLEEDGSTGKLAGILVEERNGVLVAGLGVNCLHVPGRDFLREGAVLPPARLPAYFSPKSPIPLWLALERAIIIIYGETFLAKPRSHLLRLTEEKLLWRNKNIQVNDDSKQFPLVGKLAGLSDQGGLMLLAYDESGRPEQLEIISGGISLVI